MTELKSSIFNLPKHFKTALQNIVRNGAMSISSIISVTITLTLIMVIGVIGINISDITLNIEDNITIYAQVNRELSDEDARSLTSVIESVEGVKSVEFSSKDNELDVLIESLADDKEAAELFETYRNDNPLGAAYKIEVDNVREIEVVKDKIAQIEGIREARSGEESTTNMIETLGYIRNGGTIFIIGLGIVALFMIVNTIKMAINARSKEIEIMRVVGASNWYIRIPFMLEGALIGLLGSLLPIALLIFGYEFIYTELLPVIPTLFTLREPMPFILEFSGILAGVGVGVGFAASTFSVTRFLKF